MNLYCKNKMYQDTVDSIEESFDMFFYKNSYVERRSSIFSKSKKINYSKYLICIVQAHQNELENNNFKELMHFNAEEKNLYLIISGFNNDVDVIEKLMSKTVNINVQNRCYKFDDFKNVIFALITREFFDGNKISFLLMNKN